MNDALDIRSLDSGNQLEAVLALPDHLRDALWRVDSARLEPWESSGLVVCGVGGSAIGGDLAAAALGDRLSLPLTTVRGYGLPAWTPPDRTVLCSSYSGGTEETLACYAAAEALGARRVVASTGGRLAEAARRDGVPVIGLPATLPSPRAAVGYMFTAAVELAALCGAAVPIRPEIDSSAAHLEAQRESLVERAAVIAAELDGLVPVIYGGALTSPVAYRWKCELNENAKAPAFSHELPELDHNEIVGWHSPDRSAGFGAVFLEDSGQHPRERERFELTARLIAERAGAVVR
ncbi:MAG: bifunctional phosphoglucose/phosphomannose isomerase, partial [Solirubrobacterales bacterium]